MTKPTKVKRRRTARPRPHQHALPGRLDDDPSSVRAAHSPQSAPSPAYISRLADPLVQRIQRQAIAARLGRVGGNRYVQRLLSDVEHHGPVPAVTQAPSTTLQRQPQPAPPEDAAPETAVAPVHPDLDALVQGELEGFLEEFQNITITVKWVEDSSEGTEPIQHEEQVAVHPPYFMNVRNREKAGERTLERYDTAVANRKAATRSARKLISEFSRSTAKGGMGLRRAKIGKSHPEDIRQILQAAVDRDLVKPGKGRDRPNAQDLREWLVHHGVGVDCSGFVSQALNRVMEVVQERPLEADETLASGARKIKSEGTQVTDPAELRPGDTMHIPAHIRIITSVSSDADGNVVFVTAESRAGGKADVGPDRAEWRYVGGKLQKRKSGETKWKRSKEKPTFFRYHRLAALDQAP